MRHLADLHVHLWEHRPGPVRVERDQLAAYCRAAAAQGVEAIAITEHLERFTQVRRILADAWADDPNPELRVFMDRVFEQEGGADLDSYVGELLKARDDGLPVLVGIELGWWPDRVPALARVIADYPFDVVLGSVHNLGAWMFDAYDEPAVAAEWERRDPEEVWDSYVAAVEDLAGQHVCDVLAHVDLIKLTGRYPADVRRFHDRLADAAAANDLAVEISSAGWRKPVAEAYPSPDLLRTLTVPVTLASDAHRVDHIADRFADLRRLATRPATFRRRERIGVPDLP